MKINKKEIGKRLKELRLKHRYTLEDMANFIGTTSKVAIFNWETGKSKPKDTKEQPFLTRYSDFFDVSKDWILYGTLGEYIQDILNQNNINIYSDEINHFILTCINKYSKLPPKIENKLLYLSSEELESEELSKQYIDYPSESSILHDYNKFIHDTSLKGSLNQIISTTNKIIDDKFELSQKLLSNLKTLLENNLITEEKYNETIDIYRDWSSKLSMINVSSHDMLKEILDINKKLNSLNNQSGDHNA